MPFKITNAGALTYGVRTGHRRISNSGSRPGERVLVMRR